MAIAFNTGNANTGTGDMLKATYDTDNDGKVDKAEAIDDGTYTATAANIADAVTKKHTQNTDTGTTSATFTANSVAVILEGDARLTNARTPASHNNTYHTETYITSAGVPTAGSTPTAEAFGDTQDGGTGTTWSKNDHRHAMPAAPTYSSVGAEQSGAVATHSGLTTGVHGVGTGEIVGRSLVDFATHEFYIKDEPLVIGSGELLTIGTDNTALVWCDSNKAMATTLIEYITRQVIVRDEPFVIDFGTVAVIGYDGSASVWCDSNRFWDRSNNGFQTLIDLNVENLYIVANNEVLDLVADDPVNRHLDQPSLDRGVVWIR